MIRRRLNYLGFLLRVTTLLLPLFAFAIAGYIRFGSGLIPLVTSDVDARDYFGLLFFATLAWAIVLDHTGLVRFDGFFLARRTGWTAFRSCAFTYVAVMGATFFYRSASFSRAFVALSAVALLLLTLSTQWLFRLALEQAHNKGGNVARILVVGADPFAVRAARLMMEGLVPCTLAGFVRLPDQKSAVKDYPVIDLEELKNLTLDSGIDDVVIAVPGGRFGDIPGLMKALEHLCVPIRAILDLGEGVRVRELLFDFGGLRMLDLRATPSESVIYLVAKRALDLVVSTLVLVLTAPLMALIALAIRLTSGRPVLFAQRRVGLSGRIFRMYKFRTMRLDDPAESDQHWTTAGDPCCTPLGKLLRRTNLDELPQFFNVLRGDMSIVGPRPERPFFVQKFLQDVAQYNTRHYLKVGITGWAQVNGWRGDTSIPRRIEHDLYYLRNWSLAFDLKIMFLTVWRTLVANRNAY
jgi:Undecaprenyl-phosphate glucose phosphotransferase